MLRDRAPNRPEERIMTSASRLLSASIADARRPTKTEIERVAERLWQDAFAGPAGMSWQKVERDSAAHQIVERLALAAFGFNMLPERAVI